MISDDDPGRRLDRARRVPVRPRGVPDPVAAAQRRPARGQRLRGRRRRRLDLIDSGWSLAESRELLVAALRELGAGSATSVGSWSPTCTATTTRRRSRCAASSEWDRAGPWRAVGVGGDQHRRPAGSSGTPVPVAPRGCARADPPDRRRDAAERRPLGLGVPRRVDLRRRGHRDRGRRRRPPAARGGHPRPHPRPPGFRRRARRPAVLRRSRAAPITPSIGLEPVPRRARWPIS